MLTSAGSFPQRNAYHLRSSPPSFPFSPNWVPFPSFSATPNPPPNSQRSLAPTVSVDDQPNDNEEEGTATARIINTTPSSPTSPSSTGGWLQRSPSPRRIPRRRSSAQWGLQLPHQPPPPNYSPPNFPLVNSPPFHEQQYSPYPQYQHPQYDQHLEDPQSIQQQPHLQEQPQHQQMQQPNPYASLSREEARRLHRMSMAIPEDPQDDDALFDVRRWLEELDRFSLGEVGRSR